MKKLAAVLAIALCLSVSACGPSGSSDDEAKAADSISDAIVAESASGNTGSLTDMDRKDADCVGEKMVDRIGLDQLREYGLLDKANKVQKDVDQVEMSTDDAEAMTDTFFDCTDVMGLLHKSMKAAGGDNPEMQACLEKALTEDSVRSMLTSTFTGDTDKAGKALQEPLMKCVTDAQG
jgi:hypothetical protein